MSEHETLPAPPEMRSYADSIFEPWERILILSIALDDVPAGPTTDTMRAVLNAAIAVVRNMQGRATSRKEAFASVARANAAIRVLVSMKGVVMRSAEACIETSEFERSYAEARGIDVVEARRRLLGIAETRVIATDGYAARKKRKRGATP